MSILHDRPTVLYLRGTAGIVLALIIISVY